MSKQFKEIVLDFLERFSSRKFLLAVVGALVIFGIPLSNEQIAAITAIIVAFTAAEGAADYQTRKTNIPPIDEFDSEAEEE